MTEEGKAYDLKHKLLEYFERKRRQVPIVHGSLHGKSGIDPIPDAVYQEDPVYIRNASGTVINPSTEETLTSVLSKLADILARLDVNLSTRASESSLTSVLDRNIAKWGSTPLTGRDISLDLAKLSGWDEGGRAKVNVATKGGQNIVIDNLTQSAYTELRQTISNDAYPDAPYGFDINAYRGKFFPRGMRGYITLFYAHVKNTKTTSVTVGGIFAFSPYIGGPEIFTVSLSVTLGAGADSYASVGVNIFWPFDSLFVYPKSFLSGTAIAYDLGTPYDSYSSSDSGVTWSADAYRRRMKVEYAGRTVGDLPVAGTVQSILGGGLFNYMNIAAAATTVVKYGRGFLHGITVNGGTLGSITVYDNTAASGTVIAALDTLSRQTYRYNVIFRTGLTVVTAAATNITVSYL